MKRETRNLIIFIIVFVIVGVILWYGLSVAVQQEIQRGPATAPTATAPSLISTTPPSPTAPLALLSGGRLRLG
jgi:hypothetical protein